MSFRQISDKYVWVDRRLKYDKFSAAVRRINRVTIVLGIVVLGLAGIVWSQNQWAGILYVIVAVSQLIIALTLSVRLHDRDDATRAGNVVVQHSWGLLSIGIATAAIVPSEFFAVESAWMSTAVTAGILWALIGAYGIYLSTQGVGARMTV